MLTKKKKKTSDVDENFLQLDVNIKNFGNVFISLILTIVADKCRTNQERSEVARVAAAR